MAAVADGRWELTALGKALAPAKPGEGEALDTYADHLRRSGFAVWAGLADVIRGAEPPRYPVDELSDRAVDAGSWALGVTDTVVRAVVLPEGAHLADIGGGLGGVAQALLELRPDLTVSLVELPPTAERAASRLAEADGGSQVAVIPYRGQRRLEPPADRCLLSRVVATLDDSAAVEVLGFAARSLTEGGRVEIIDFEADGTPAAAFGDLLHLARSGGAIRSREEWDELARRAGLRIAGRHSLDGPYVHLSMALEQGATSAAPEPTDVATAP
jgi:hypothetical protein